MPQLVILRDFSYSFSRELEGLTGAVEELCVVCVSADAAVCSWFYHPCATLSFPLENMINQNVLSAFNPLLCYLEVFSL